jgi:ABC-type bacteriocin/lantibiotic exporter with double-glycine peptidase domain
MRRSHALAGARAFRGLRPTVQETTYTCGPAAMQCVLRLAGRRTTERRLTKLLRTSTRHGTTPAAMLAAATALRLRPELYRRLTVRELVTTVKRGHPVIVLWNADGAHWAVAVGYDAGRILLADPADRSGLCALSQSSFRRRWSTTVAGVPYRGLGIVCKP